MCFTPKTLILHTCLNLVLIKLTYFKICSKKLVPSTTWEELSLFRDLRPILRIVKLISKLILILILIVIKQQPRYLNHTLSNNHSIKTLNISVKGLIILRSRLSSLNVLCRKQLTTNFLITLKV
jgi:hypothetical protein